MKKAIQVTTVAAALALVAVGAHAQSTSSSFPSPSRLYGSIGYESIDITTTDGTNQARSEPGVLMGTIGYQLHPNLAVEGVVGGTVKKDDVRLNGLNTGIDGSIDSTYGVFVKPSVNLTDRFSVFGRVGYVHTKASLSSGSVSVSESGEDTAYGLGASYALTPNSYVQANWTQYYDRDGVEAKGWGVAYGLRF
ncbi:MAG: outer membrane beta-barrel protein [Hydrogenophaga sp.]|nr:outer membrane beta-barrel protein [Hydrogenophaga sp.]